MAEYKVILWRDEFDTNTFHVGTKSNVSGRVTCWSSIFIDGIDELFGRDVYTRANQLLNGLYMVLDIDVSVED